MNILRMIKLFAWEDKLSEQLGEKREEELTWLKKQYWLGLVNMNIKYGLLCLAPIAGIVKLTRALGASYILPLLTMIITFSTYVRCAPGDRLMLADFILVLFRRWS